jgi:hypothetical protein
LNPEVAVLTFHEEMQELMDEMANAHRAGDAHSCAQMFTPDGALYSSYAFPARGRAEIESLHRGWTAEGTGKQLKVKEASSSGNLGWCLVAYSECATTAMELLSASLNTSPAANGSSEFAAVYEGLIAGKPAMPRAIK